MTIQAGELKKKAEDEAEVAAQLKEVRAKQAKEIEALQLQLDELQAAYDKLEKSKKKLQAEVEDLNIDVETQRAKVLELEKKQRNFDKVLAEEKVSGQKTLSSSGEHIWARGELSSFKRKLRHISSLKGPILKHYSVLLFHSQ